MNQNPIEVVNDATKQKLMYGAGCAFELTKNLIIIVIIATLANYFVATIAIVDGPSMEPNFHTKEGLLINRWAYNFGKPERGDAVVLKFPGDPERKKYIKRIIGLPGERIQIQNGKVYINNQLLEETYIPSHVKTDSPSRYIDEIIKPDEYFIIGDNRPNSNDSRVWGTAGKRFLIGKASIQLWPKQKNIPQPTYK